MLKLISETDASIETLAKWLRIVQDSCLVKDSLTNSTPVKVSVEKQYTVQ